jgi:hypothetical protein
MILWQCLRFDRYIMLWTGPSDERWNTSWICSRVWSMLANNSSRPRKLVQSLVPYSSVRRNLRVRHPFSIRTKRFFFSHFFDVFFLFVDDELETSDEKLLPDRSAYLVELFLKYYVEIFAFESTGIQFHPSNFYVKAATVDNFVLLLLDSNYVEKEFPATFFTTCTYFIDNVDLLQRLIDHYREWSSDEKWQARIRMRYARAVTFLKPFAHKMNINVIELFFLNQYFNDAQDMDQAVRLVASSRRRI